MSGRTGRPYKHAEAFCLMTYRADDGSEEEVIWNSRDGVTPFVITLRSGKSATHVNWANDVCIPNYNPLVGSRIFVDLTEERALEAARNNLARWTEEGVDMTDAPSAEELAREYLRQGPGAPDLIEVTEQWNG